VAAAPKPSLKKVSDILGVQAAEGRLIFDTGYRLANDKEGTIRIIGIPAACHQEVDDLQLNKGRYLNSNDKNQALVDENFIGAHKLKIDDTITAIINGKEQKIEIVGVVSSPEYLFPFRSKEDFAFSGEFGAIFMPQKEVERLFKTPPIYNNFAVLAKKGTDENKVIDQVEETLAPFQVLATVKQADQPSNFRVNEEIRQNKETSSFMPGLILIISALSIYIALSRLVQSQRGEIGLSKALGYSNSKLLLHYLIFAAFIAVTGSLLGFALGQFFAIQIIKLYLSYYHIPFLKHLIYPEQFWTSVIISGVACFFGGLIPAYASSRIRPAVAMRSDPSLSIVKAKTPLIERAFWFIRFPFTIKIPLRNVFRVKKRSIYTIIGIAFALILTVATWASFDTMDYLVDTQFNKIDRWDLLVGFEQNFNNSLIKKVEDFKGAEKVQSAALIPAKISADGKKHESTITALQPNATFHNFRITKGDSAKTALRKGGLIMTPKIAEKLDVQVGNTLAVKTPFLKKGRKMKLLAISDELLGAPIFIGYKEGKELLNTKKTLTT
jgi:putative ABC transport system permease protein